MCSENHSEDPVKCLHGVQQCVAALGGLWNELTKTLNMLTRSQMYTRHLDCCCNTQNNPNIFISLFTPMTVTAVGRRELSRGVWGSEWVPLLKSHLRHFMCGMNWQACLNTQMRSVRGASVSNESWYSLRGTEQLQLLWPVVYQGVKKKEKKKERQ